ncbi:MAG: hypothetical protein VB092_08805, partial [Oscillospiraceae bacterium]|nr:hypothetical protein [Oscillospiraceae bacterium]
ARPVWRRRPAFVMRTIATYAHMSSETCPDASGVSAAYRCNLKNAHENAFLDRGQPQLLF